MHEGRHLWSYICGICDEEFKSYDRDEAQIGATHCEGQKPTHKHVFQVGDYVLTNSQLFGEKIVTIAALKFEKRTHRPYYEVFSNGSFYGNVSASNVYKKTIGIITL